MECAAVHLHSKQAGECEGKGHLKIPENSPQAKPWLCMLEGGIVVRAPACTVQVTSTTEGAGCFGCELLCRCVTS